MTAIANAPAWLVVGAAVVIVAAVGFIDLLTDPNLAYSSFYVLPVLIASWRGPRSAGMTLATIGAVVWTIAHIRTFPSRPPSSTRPGISSCAFPRSHCSRGW